MSTVFERYPSQNHIPQHDMAFVWRSFFKQAKNAHMGHIIRLRCDHYIWDSRKSTYTFNLKGLINVKIQKKLLRKISINNLGSLGHSDDSWYFVPPDHGLKLKTLVETHMEQNVMSCHCDQMLPKMFKFILRKSFSWLFILMLEIQEKLLRKISFGNFRSLWQLMTFWSTWLGVKIEN